MAIILNIETTTKNCSVSLAKNGEVIAIKELNNGNYSHAEVLHPFISDVLKEATISFTEIDAIAVSKGPGSYTGLRIGVSSAKGLCYAHSIPLISINSLEVLAAAYTPETSDLLIPMFDARRMEVFTMVLNAKKEVVSRTEIITSYSFKELRDQGRLVLFGNGSNKCKGIIPEENTYFVDSLKEPYAQHMVVTATNKFEAKQFEGTAYFEPFYLKDFYTNPPKV